MTEEFKWHKFGDIYPADTVSNFYVREPELFRLVDWDRDSLPV